MVGLQVHSDVSQIYQVTLNYRKALEHCRMARQLLAGDPCIEKERVKVRKRARDEVESSACPSSLLRSPSRERRDSE